MIDLIKTLDIKSALIGAVATILLMAVCCLPFIIINGIDNASKRYEQGQRQYIQDYKAELKLNQSKDN